MTHLVTLAEAMGSTDDVIDLVLLGAGGGAQDVLDIIDALNDERPRVKLLGMLDDHRERGSKHLGLEVLGGLDSWPNFAAARFISTIRSEHLHRHHPAIISRIGLPAGRLATLVHPRAGVSRRARLGRGVCVCDGASVGGGVSVGDHVFLGPHSITGHDTRIGGHSSLAAGSLVGGRVSIGRAVYVGSGASVRPELSIGDGSLLGLGAVVVRDVARGTVVVGNPARPLERSPLRGVIG